MTFSIVACDERHIGVATASHWVAAGALVPWAEPGAGAVATQAFTDPAYGPDGLARMRAGAHPAEALAALAARDPRRDLRQVIMLDPHGRTAAMTGPGCFTERASVTAAGVAAAGNMLGNDAVPRAMIDALNDTAGSLPARLVAALRAGQRAGGDARGRQAAALRVVHRHHRPGDGHGVVADLRVDDHRDPIAELSRLLRLHDRGARLTSAAFPSETPALTTGDPDRLRSAIKALRAIAGEPGDPDPEAALWLALCHLRAGDPTAAEDALAGCPHLWPLVQRWDHDLRSRTTA